ncbi:hypothetical protein KBC75_01355 [Candidatus Shapirobacteria bacterium]|nr:hypothetical protein [Candidatus Shapirobacteria bacterium]
MKLYFSAPRAYREKFGVNYENIMKVLVKSEYKVTDNGRLKSPSGAYSSLSKNDRLGLYRTMLKNIEKADICVFEASFPSTLHIGHEITVALEKGKPVIVLHTADHEPILFTGIQNNKVIWIEYDESNLMPKLTEALEQARKIIDVRFNFFVSPRILSYLDWVAKKRMIPRSVFLRDLIEKEMKKDKDYT